MSTELAKNLISFEMVSQFQLLATICLIFFAHFIGDFIFQSDEVAKNKSSSNHVLAEHVTKYSVVFIFLCGIYYAIANFILHFITDYVSSRLTTKAFKENRRHDFFVIIGADQLIHKLCLLGTLPLIAKFSLIGFLLF